MDEKTLSYLTKNIPQTPGLQLPPQVFLDMEGEILELDVEAQTIKARFPIKERYHNPMQNMQGGMIIAAVDNTMGPLSFMVAPPSVTGHINTSFIRPVKAEYKFIYVEAQVTEITDRQLFMSAQVMNAEDKVLTICHATFIIVGK